MSSYKLSPRIQTLLSDHVSQELYAANTYLNFYLSFLHSEKALKGASLFFKKMYEEELEHARMFMEYIVERGGHVNSTYNFEISHCRDVNSSGDTFSLLDAIKRAIDAEQHVYECLDSIHEEASLSKDHHLCDFIETKFLDEQVKGIKQLLDLSTTFFR